MHFMPVTIGFGFDMAIQELFTSSPKPRDRVASRSASFYRHAERQRSRSLYASSYEGDASDDVSVTSSSRRKRKPSVYSASSADELDFNRARSGLRLSGSKFASKGPSRRGRKVYRHSQPDAESVKDEEQDSTMEVDNVGPSKRKSDAADVDVRPRKRHASRTQEINIDDLGSDSSETLASDDDTVTGALPLRWKEGRSRASHDEAIADAHGPSKGKARAIHSGYQPPEPPSIPPLMTEVFPSTDPNGPGGSWTCQVDGCTHKVFGAHKALGQRLVKEHIAEHGDSRAHELDEDDDDDYNGGDGEALRLIRSEEEQCQLPVRYVRCFQIQGAIGLMTLPAI